LDLAKLQGVDDAVVGEGVRDHHQPGAVARSVSPFQVGERVLDGLLGVGAERHREGLDAPVVVAVENESVRASWIWPPR
jgi:hypothetical protein